MLITVHKPQGLFSSGVNLGHLINTDHVKSMVPVKVGNYADLGTKITFADGEVLKVTTTLEDIRKQINPPKTRGVVIDGKD